MLKAGTTEEEGVRVVKETGLDTDERIEITDSSHDHDKSSSSGGSSSSSSDDESQEVKRKDGDKEETQVIITPVPSQPVPVAGDAPFIFGSTANAIVENTGLMNSTTPSDLNTENIVEISSVDSVLSNEPAAEVSDESKQASSSTTGSDKKESKSGVPEGSKESEVVIFHEEEVILIVNLFDLLSLMSTNKRLNSVALSGSRATNTWSCAKNLMVKLLWFV